MTPERYQQIERIYQQAVERAADERAAFLDAACAGDEELRRDLEALLASEEHAGDFLEAPAGDLAAGVLAEQQASSLVGRRLGHYQIRSLVGAGGMGEVYKAVDVRLNRVVALKALSPTLMADATARRRFLREARAASSLSHPNICTVFDVGEEGNLIFIAMQYVEGVTLQQRLAEGPLALEDVLNYAVDIAEALEEAHKHGIIHRDIKPSNIVIAERGVAVVLDFGLAKRFAQADESAGAPESQQTTADTLVGTAAYMSPEQVRSQPLNARSDIFSFGVVLYEMLTGIRPFDGPSVIERLHAVLHVEPTPLSRLRPEAPIGLERIVKQALRKDPADRYQTATEIKNDLLRLIQENSATFSRTGASVRRRLFPAIQSSVLLPRQVFFVRLGLAFVALSLIVAAIGWLVLRRSDQNGSAWLLSLRHVELMNWKSEFREGSTLGRFSPDGRMIAYSLVQGEHRKVWIRQTIGGDSIQITKDDSDSWGPVWSPDGQQIAYVSQRGTQVGIWVVPALGGTPKLISPLENRTPNLKHWSKDGTIYYQMQQQQGYQVYALNVASKETSQLTNLDEAVDFSVSPDEEWIAYAAMKERQRDIWIMPRRGGPPVQVTDDPTSDQKPIWHPDGKRIIYNCDRDGTLQLCLAYPDGRKPVQITVGESDSPILDISSDGTRILYTRSKEDGDLWRVNLATGEELEVTSDIGVELWPDISPDGTTVAYQACKEPSGGRKLLQSSILIRPSEGARQPIELAVDGLDPRWAPDGSKLAFLRQSGTLTNLWTVEPISGTERQLTTTGVVTRGFSRLPYNRIQPPDYAWSSDNSKIAFCSNRSGQQEIHVISTDTLSETKVSGEPKNSETFFSPLWSPDGKRIAYISFQRASSAEAKAIWSVWIAGQEQPAFVFQSSTTVRLIGWSNSGDDVIVGVAEDSSSLTVTVTDMSLLQVSTVGAGKRPIARLSSTYFMNVQLSPDARTIGFVSRQDGRDNIWTIPTSGGEAKKITANPDSRLYFSSIAWSPDGKSIYYGKQSKWGLISMIDNFK